MNVKPFKKMNKNNTALLIVDVINSCASEKCEILDWNIHFTKVREMVPKLEDFIPQFRTNFNGPVIFGRTLPWQQETLANNINELYEDERFKYYTSDRSGFAEALYKIKPETGDIIADKNTNDALADSKLLAKLQKQNIRYIMVTGTFTDGCVLATVIGGFSRGYSMIVLEDLVETTDVPARQKIQEELLSYTFPYMFARVINSNDLLSSFAR